MPTALPPVPPVGSAPHTSVITASGDNAQVQYGGYFRKHSCFIFMNFAKGHDKVTITTQQKCFIPYKKVPWYYRGTTTVLPWYKSVVFWTVQYPTLPAPLDGDFLRQRSIDYVP